MIYSLRKLIAFVFLLGMFWFVYQNPADLEKSEFTVSLCLMTVLFGLFYVFIPIMVVRFRGWRRMVHNRRGYLEWKKSHSSSAPMPMHRNRGPGIRSDEVLYFHEKGTLYVDSGVGYDEISVEGKIGDVAFPKERRSWRKIQRVHCYFAASHLIFVGKSIERRFGYGEIKSFRVAPGGIVFVLSVSDRQYEIAFTFQNPLIAADVFAGLNSREIPR